MGTLIMPDLFSGDNPDREHLARELAARGMVPFVAFTYATDKDPDLIAKVLVCFDQRMEVKRFENPGGALRDMLDHPEKWLQRSESGWEPPPPREKPTPTPSYKPTSIEQMLRWRERTARDAAQAVPSPGLAKIYLERRTPRPGTGQGGG
jgi:hypothetical protein